MISLGNILIAIVIRKDFQHFRVSGKYLDALVSELIKHFSSLLVLESGKLVTLTLCHFSMDHFYSDVSQIATNYPILVYFSRVCYFLRKLCQYVFLPYYISSTGRVCGFLPKICTSVLLASYQNHVLSYFLWKAYAKIGSQDYFSSQTISDTKPLK